MHSSKKALQNTAKATWDLVRKKIVDKITRAVSSKSTTPPQTDEAPIERSKNTLYTPRKTTTNY